MDPNECVLCLRRSAVASLGIAGKGFSPSVSGLMHLLGTPTPLFVPRGECEGNPEYRQVIPYVTFVYRIDKGPISIFTYERTVDGEGEGRLRGKYSLGIGGHINLDDLRSAPNRSSPTQQSPAPGILALESGMRREVREEVTIHGRQPEIVPVGVIDDDSDEVGRDHVGVVYIGNLEHKEIFMRCIDIDLMESIEDVRRDFGMFERWSQIVFESVLVGM